MCGTRWKMLHLYRCHMHMHTAGSSLMYSAVICITVLHICHTKKVCSPPCSFYGYMRRSANFWLAFVSLLHVTASLHRCLCVACSVLISLPSAVAPSRHGFDFVFAERRRILPASYKVVWWHRPRAPPTWCFEFGRMVVESVDRQSKGLPKKTKKKKRKHERKEKITLLA